MLTLRPLPAFVDNYTWVSHDERHTQIVDPGESAQVLDYLQKHGLALQGILLTHHYSDHVGGVQTLRQQTGIAVYGPAGESIPEPARRLRRDDRVDVLKRQLEAIDMSGHITGHTAYFGVVCPDGPPSPCGDTLFSGGCGRLFEGTSEQILASLDTLMILPAQAQVCPAHEYTLISLRFAQTVEPSNEALTRHMPYYEMLRAQESLTLPGRLGLERQINPFLRSRGPSVRQSLNRLPSASLDDVHVFAAFRGWKNNFQ